MSDFEFSFATPGRPAPVRRDTATMRLLVLADLRGGNENRPPLAERQPRRIDIDNFDALMKRYSPTLNLSGKDARVSLVCPTLEHFEPDALYAHLANFDAMPQDGAGPPAETPAAAAQTDESVGDALGRLLGGDTGKPRKSAAAGILDNFIGKIVADDIKPSSDSEDAQRAGADAAAAEVMRGLLHEPSLQRLEATWRGLDALVRGVEMDEGLSNYVMDVTVEELSADLLGGDRQNSTLVTRLVEEGVGSFGGEPWDVLVVDAALGAQDAELIAALGAVAKAAGGKVLVDADIDGLDQEPPPAWQALRSSNAAKNVHLTTPRVLLRAPYGKQNDMPDCFDFEECPAEPDNGELLWGSAALLVATCLAQAFEAQVRHGNLSDQDAARDRPLFVFERDGTRTVQSAAQVLLSDRQAEGLRERWGVMPLRPERNGNRLLFPKLQSLAT